MIEDQEDIREERRRVEQRAADEAAMDALVLEEDEEERPVEVDGRDIEVITVEILDYKRIGGEAIIEIGKRLTEAKGMLSHGEWLPWLNERVEFSERVAQKFMKLANEWANPNTLSDLGYSKALKLLALPQEERDAFMAEPHEVNGIQKTVIDMSARELDKAIRERDAARLAVEAAKADAANAEQSKAKMETDMAEANRLLDLALEQREQVAADVARLERELAELKAQPVEVAVMEVDEQALAAAKAEGFADAEAQTKAELEKAQKAKATAEKKQAKAEKAQEAAEQQRQKLEAELEEARRRMAELEKAEKQAVMGSDKELAQFEVIFLQGQEVANKLRGYLLKARSREDQAVATGMQKSMLALAEAIGRCAE